MLLTWGAQRNLPEYMICALRTVFGGSWWRTIFRAFCISLLYGIILLAGLVSLFMLAILDPLGIA